MKELFKNKWAWAVCILVILNIITIGAMWYSMCGRGDKMHCRRNAVHHHGGHGHGHENGYRDFKHGHDRRKGEDFLSQELNLTEKQEASFDTLRKEHFIKMKVNRDSMQALKKEMLKSLGKTDVEINSIIQKIGALEMVIQKELFDHFNQMYAICTDSQKIQLIEKLEKVVEHHGPGFAQKNGDKYKIHDGGAANKSCCSAPPKRF